MVGILVEGGEGFSIGVGDGMCMLSAFLLLLGVCGDVFSELAVGWGVRSSGVGSLRLTRGGMRHRE